MVANLQSSDASPWAATLFALIPFRQQLFGFVHACECLCARERWRVYTMNMRILYAINCTKHRIWHLEMEMEQQAEWERSVCRIFRIKTLIGHGHVHSKMVTAHSHIEWNFQYNLENYLIECSESLSAPDRLGTPSHTWIEFWKYANATGSSIHS